VCVCEREELRERERGEDRESKWGNFGKDFAQCPVHKPAKCDLCTCQTKK
jgi:hypothetical protein